MLLGIPRSARCVQRFDDSLNSAIHITYRISLRSSSMREPRDPLLKVVFCFIGLEPIDDILHFSIGVYKGHRSGNSKRAGLATQQSSLPPEGESYPDLHRVHR
jgi:hypothetical protein